MKPQKTNKKTTEEQTANFPIDESIKNLNFETISTQIKKDISDIQNQYPNIQKIQEIQENHLIDQKLEQLKKYSQELIKWNKVYNLSALQNLPEIYILHILDCIIPFYELQNIIKKHQKEELELKTSKKILDVGSGAGLPGLIWAILDHELEITSIDAVQKKIAFQENISQQLNLVKFKALHQRVETFSEQFSFITARAYADIEKLLDDTKNLRDTSEPHHGYFLLKGQITDDIVKAQTKYPAMQVQEISIPYLEAKRHLVYLPFCNI